MSNIQRKVQPIITACLDGMVKAGDTCDPAKVNNAIAFYTFYNFFVWKITTSPWVKSPKSSLYECIFDNMALYFVYFECRIN